MRWRQLLLVAMAPGGGCGSDDSYIVDPACVVYRCDDAGNIILPDASPPDAPFTSPALPGASEQCLGGQKLTWIIVQDSPEPSGALVCVPDGFIGAGGACMSGAPGEFTGYDDCVAGLACTDEICADICELEAPPGSPAGCAIGTCMIDDRLFLSPYQPPRYGVCR